MPIKLLIFNNFNNDNMENVKKGLSIPPRDRKEWRDLVMNEIDYEFKNFVLQLKNTEYRRKIKKNEIDIETAIDELYTLCQKYSKAVQGDFKIIFKSW